MQLLTQHYTSTKRNNYVKYLILFTIIFSIYDHYVFSHSVPLKGYYLPIFIFPFIYFLKKPSFRLQINSWYIIPFSIYFLLIMYSYLRSPYRNDFGLSSPIIFTIGIVVIIFTFTSFYLLFDKNRHFEFTNKVIKWGVIINTVIAVSIMILTNVLNLNIGTILRLGSYVRVSGFYAEPDIFGFYVSSIAVFLFPQLKRSSVFRLNFVNISFFLCTLLNILTVTRTTLISEFACIMFYLFIKKKGRKLVVLLFIVGGIFLAGTIFHENDFIGRMGMNSTKSDSGAFNSRLYSVLLNINEIKKSILFGSGPGYLLDLAHVDENVKFYASGGDINTNRNGTLFLLGEIFNTGLLGLIVILYLFLMIYKTLNGLNKEYYKTIPTEYIQFIDGIKLLFINAFIVSLSNTVIKMVFVWVFIGIGCKMVVQIKKEIGQPVQV